MTGRLDYNLHSHTSRCGHAIGEDADFARAAYDVGFTQLGFSDHVMLPQASQPGIRGDYDLLEDYISSVSRLKEQYRGKMDIRLGFEAEWYGAYFLDYYRRLLQRYDFDYLLMGQHCFIDDGFFVFYGRLPRDEATRRYRDDVIAGIRSGLFTYVCHPDLYVSWRGVWDETNKQAARDIALAAKEYGVPLELNCGALRYNPFEQRNPRTLLYPCPMFWDEVAKIGPKVVIGVDAHNPRDYFITDYSFYADFAAQRGLDLLLESPLK